MNCHCFNSNRYRFFLSNIISASHNEISRYSSEEISGYESIEVTSMTESERQAEISRQKEEMKIKRRKKKRTSSSMQSSTFKGTCFLLLTNQQFEIVTNLILTTWIAHINTNEPNEYLAT